MASRFRSRLNIVVHALPRLILGRRKPLSPKRILVSHHLLLGDTIMLAGLYKKLRRDHPDAGIDSLVPTAWLPLFAASPYGVRALGYDPRAADGQQSLIKQGPYDWALVPADNRWAWIARAMGARWITAFASGGGLVKGWPVDEFIEWPQVPEAWGDIASRLAPGPEPEPFRAGEWPAPPPPSNMGALPKTPYAVLHLGASSPHKLWPPDRWLALAGVLHDAGLNVVWSAGPKEHGLVAAADPQGRFTSVAGKFDISGMWHLLAGAALLVSPDTGIAHLARLTSTPATVLFGPGSPVVSGPGRFWQHSPFAVVWHQSMACRNQNLLFERQLPWVQHCWRSVDQCGQPQCMWQIDSREVLKAIHSVCSIGAAGIHTK